MYARKHKHSHTDGGAYLSMSWPTVGPILQMVKKVSGRKIGTVRFLCGVVVATAVISSSSSSPSPSSSSSHKCV